MTRNRHALQQLPGRCRPARHARRAHAHHGRRLPTRSSPASPRSAFPEQANGSLIVKDRRSWARRSSASRSRIRSTSGVGSRRPRRRVQRRGVDRLEPRPDERGAHEERQGADRRAARRRSGEHGAHPGRSRHLVGQRPRSRTSPRPPPSIRSRGSPVRAASTEDRVARSWPSTPRAATSGSSASRASTCSLNLALDALKSCSFAGSSTAPVYTILIPARRILPLICRCCR